MVAKLFLIPQPLFLSPKFFIFSNKHSLPQFLLVSSFSSSFTTQPQDHSLSYGPSLHKGTKPIPILHSQLPLKTLNQNPEQDKYDLLDEESFTRVFDISAIRAPSKECFTLESRLRGHLLNWPRIRNVARVPGDEVEPEIIELVGEQRKKISEEDDDDDGNEIGIDSLQRRIYGKSEGDGELLSPVLYREKLVKTFNSRGFVNFRNLAKISRPKKKKRKEEEEERGNGKRRIRRNEFALIEVVEDEEKEEEDMRGLLGDEFKNGKWRGSTRLLLLDERFAGKGEEELPEAIKVLCKQFIFFILV